MGVVIDGIKYVPRLKLQNIGKESFGAMLIGLRKSAMYTLDKAAAEIGCSKTYLWGMEHDNNEPSLRMAAMIAEAYGVPILALARSLDGMGSPDEPLLDDGLHVLVSKAERLSCHKCEQAEWERSQAEKESSNAKLTGPAPKKE